MMLITNQRLPYVNDVNNKSTPSLSIFLRLGMLYRQRSLKYIQINTYCHTFSLKRHVLQCLNLIYPTFYGVFLWCSSKQDVTGFFVKM